ncbi:DHCW motif cupin fold protein [Hymenobacter glaciei]|uniref:DHCW motif cupin fold protein n=1 Tax=Hymenobacter glaciei TaxID=877209 RepID=A0ABP7T403_9BACT
MQITDLPFGVTNWAEVAGEEHPGITGVATWRTRQFGPVRVRMVDYSPDYLADHWCQKGHFLLVTAGELITELADGRIFTLTAGMSYQVADGAEAHRSNTVGGAALFIVD